jgi:redox-sensing transcriptional repressor
VTPPRQRKPARSPHPAEEPLPRPVIGRLAHYHQITSRAGAAGQSHVSSAELAGLVGVDATMVRKDMASAGIAGRPKVGYFIGDVITRLDEVLGLQQRKAAVLIGAGSLGSAIARYGGFLRFGLEICGVFDTDFARVGQNIGGHIVLPMEKCRSVLEIFGVRIAILTVPAGATQDLVDWLVARGIRGIWNFAPVDVRAPAHVVVRHENLALGLAQFLHQFRQQQV